MAHVVLRDGESGENLLARFRAAMNRSGILREVKDHRYFRSKGEKSREAARRSTRRYRKLARRREMMDRPGSR